MKLENQVVSLELAKRLKELGVKQESLYWWAMYTDGTSQILYGISEEMGWNENRRRVSAFTVAELGEILAPYGVLEVPAYSGPQTWIISLGFTFCSYWRGVMPAIECIDDKEADARAKMLIYLLEKRLIKPPVEEAHGGGKPS